VVLVVALGATLLLTSAAAYAGDAWVLWKYQGMAYSVNNSPIETIDAFDTRADCVKAINGFEAKYRAARWHYIDRSYETSLFVSSGPIGQNREETQVRCLPDTIDPRSPKAR
jgi:hypothetical protein